MPEITCGYVTAIQLRAQLDSVVAVLMKRIDALEKALLEKQSAPAKKKPAK